MSTRDQGSALSRRASEWQAHPWSTYEPTCCISRNAVGEPLMHPVLPKEVIDEWQETSTPQQFRYYSLWS